jgi:hypothetical protein
MSIIGLKRVIVSYNALLAEVSRMMREALKAGHDSPQQKLSSWRKWRDRHDGLRFVRDYFANELFDAYGLRV